jgi:hypothetical protein
MNLHIQLKSCCIDLNNVKDSDYWQIAIELKAERKFIQVGDAIINTEEIVYITNN